MADKLPKSIGDFFLTYLKTTTQAMLIPQMALRRLINEFDDGQIEVFHAQGVGAIVSDGKLRAFIPMHLLRGEVIRVGGGSNHRLRTRATDDGLDRWIRTKHGYVYGNGALFNEMRKSAAGGFELTVRQV